MEKRQQSGQVDCFRSALSDIIILIIARQDPPAQPSVPARACPSLVCRCVCALRQFVQFDKPRESARQATCTLQDNHIKNSPQTAAAQIVAGPPLFPAPARHWPLTSVTHININSRMTR